MLEIKDLKFAYEKGPSYQFDFAVQSSEVVGIAGTSGSGKSTLLDLISGFLMPNTGTILLDEQPIHQLAAEDRPVSILFQKNNVFPHLTAAQNVQLGSKNKIDAGVCLKQVGLAGFEHQKCEALSGGQQQRVALARTLVLNKPVLLLDEPFSALDDETAEEMRELVKSLARKNNWRTILVSHQKRDFEALANRVIHLKNGKLEAQN